MAKALYTSQAQTMGGRAQGLARSSDGMLDLRLSVPGYGRIGTNPEQLLAAGWSACFESSIEIAARKLGITLPLARTVEARVSLKLADDGYFLSVQLNVGLDGLDPKRARAIADEAHRICP